MLYKPEPAQLNSREEMIRIASLYPEGLKTGSFVMVDVPFTETAYRLENGQLMAGPGCTFFPGCDGIKNQRIPTLVGITYKVGAVDEEYGVVLLRMDFGPGATFDGKNSLNVGKHLKFTTDRFTPSKHLWKEFRLARRMGGVSTIKKSLGSSRQSLAGEESRFFVKLTEL
jgi:hypothetical protein